MTHSAHRRTIAAAALGLVLAGAPLALGTGAAQAATRIQPAASSTNSSPASNADSNGSASATTSTESADATTGSGAVAQGAAAAQQEITDTSKLKPVTAADLEDGTYKIEVESSSSMFRITDATLTVANGKMTCELVMSGKGYGKLFMGTGEEAAKADDKDCIDYVENAGGTHTFTVPVEALNTDVDCAAWSIKKQAWYDRTLVFLADTLEPVDSTLADGTYSVDVTLEGGSGRASVSSPCTLKVEDGAMTATIVWSSPNYDQMVVDGTQYLPVNKDGNSTFEIPVTTLAEPLAVQAETTAMSQPHMIDYTLTFGSATPQED